jgi:hypothetical protein
MRCKNCKDVFVPALFNQKYCFKDDCVREFNLATWTKRKQVKKKELLTVQDWTKLAQQAFNGYIRERDKGKPCVSCLNPKPKKFNAGHFYSSGGHKALTFDEINVHGQCEYCNSFLSGNLHEYRKNILLRITSDELERLDAEAHNTAKYTVQELIEIAKTYKQKLNELKSSKNK